MGASDMVKAAYVCYWDDVEQDRFGDEYRLWCVALMDEHDGLAGPVREYRSKLQALDVAERMGNQLSIPVVQW